jgi:hypothetical protein
MAASSNLFRNACEAELVCFSMPLAQSTQDAHQPRLQHRHLVRATSASSLSNDKSEAGTGVLLYNLLCTKAHQHALGYSSVP